MNRPPIFSPAPARHRPPIRRSLSLLALVLLCGACASTGVKEADPSAAGQKTGPAAEAPKAAPPAPPALDKAQQELAGGVASYENGAYKLAARQVQTALALGLAAPGDQARAHKYLAFMHCVGGRQRQCRDEFGKAFEAMPSFDLSPAEAGHPIWGPVFRKVKAARARAR